MLEVMRHDSRRTSLVSLSNTSFSTTSTTGALKFDHLFLPSSATRDSFALPIDSADIQLAFGSASTSPATSQSFPSSVHPDSAFDSAELSDSSAFGWPRSSAGLKFVRHASSQTVILSTVPTSTSSRSAEYGKISSQRASFHDSRARPSSSTATSALSSDASASGAVPSPLKHNQGTRPLPAPPVQGLVLPPPAKIIVQAPPPPARQRKTGFRTHPRGRSPSSSDDEAINSAKGLELPSRWAPAVTLRSRSISRERESTPETNSKDAGPDKTAISTHTVDPQPRMSGVAQAKPKETKGNIIAAKVGPIAKPKAKPVKMSHGSQIAELGAGASSTETVNDAAVTTPGLYAPSKLAARVRKAPLPLLYIPPPPSDRYIFRNSTSTPPGNDITVQGPPLSEPHTQVAERVDAGGPQQGTSNLSVPKHAAPFDLPSAFADDSQDHAHADSSALSPALTMTAVPETGLFSAASTATAVSETTLFSAGLTAVNPPSRYTPTSSIVANEVSRFSLTSVSSIASTITITPESTDYSGPTDDSRSSIYTSLTAYDSVDTRRTSPLDVTYAFNEPSTPTPSEYAVMLNREEDSASEHSKGAVSPSVPSTPPHGGAEVSLSEQVIDISTPHPPVYETSRVHAPERLANLFQTEETSRPTRYLYSEFAVALAILESQGENHPLPAYMRIAGDGEATLARGPRHAFRPTPSLEPITIWQTPQMPVPMRDMMPSQRRRLLRLWRAARKSAAASDSPSDGSVDDMPDEMKRHRSALRAFFKFNRRGSGAWLMSDGMPTPASSTMSTPSLARSRSASARFLWRLRRGGRMSMDMDDMSMDDMDSMMDMDELSVRTTSTMPSTLTSLEDMMMAEAELEAAEGLPTVEPFPGRPLLNNGHILVYPEGEAPCEMCSNVGYTPDHDHAHGHTLVPCKRCWARFARPFGSRLARFFRKGAMDDVEDVERIRARLQRPLSAPPNM